jgi:hypothetical protein
MDRRQKRIPKQLKPWSLRVDALKTVNVGEKGLKNDRFLYLFIDEQNNDLTQLALS